MSELARALPRRRRSRAAVRQSAPHQPAQAPALADAAPLSAEGVLALQRAHGNQSVSAMLARRAAPTIQRELLVEDAGLAGLELVNVTAAQVLHVDEDAVWEITAGGASYILKLSSEKPKAELAGTLLAGALGISVAPIARHIVTAAEVEAITAVADRTDAQTAEGLESLREGKKGLLMQKLGGTDLDRLREQGGPSQQQGFDRPSFMRQLGKLAAADAVIGIGDRFKMPGIDSGAHNAGNILYDQGALHGIDYDVEQGLWAQGGRAGFRDRAVQMLQNPEQLVQVVLDSIEELTDDLQPQGGDDALIREGVQQVAQRLAEFTMPQLEELQAEANALLAGYGDHVAALIARATNRQLAGAAQDEGVGQGGAQDEFADFDFVNDDL